MTIDLSTCPPGTVGKTRGGRDVVLCYFADDDFVVGVYANSGISSAWKKNGCYLTGDESPNDIVSITAPTSASKQPDAIDAAIRNASRLISAAVLKANGDYDSKGLLHDVDWLESAVRMGE